MSAVFGWLSFNGRPVPHRAVLRMQHALAPYGPDRQDVYATTSVALGHCLRRFTPDDDHDHQPLTAADGRIRLVAAVRIYNRGELMARLAWADPPQRTADSALLLAAWVKWGVESVRYIEGDYAFAVWNDTALAVTLVRDPAGNQPLFWHRGTDFFAFASLPKALLALGDVPRSLNREHAIDAMLVLPHHSDDSFYTSIQRVLPGHAVRLNGSGLVSHPVKRLDPEARIELSSDAAYVEAFRDQLDRAVKERLRATGGVATHLSSGFDSTTVTAVTARHLAARGQSLDAYTAVPRPGFAGPHISGRVQNEGPRAAQVAERFPNVHHFLVSSHGTLLDVMALLCEETDRFIGSLSNHLWALQIQREAIAKGTSVLLSAEGGNLSISYAGLPHLATLLRCGHWFEWARELRAAGPRRRAVLLASVGPFLPLPLWNVLNRSLLRRNFDWLERAGLNPLLAHRINVAGRVRRAGWDPTHRPWRDGRAMRVALSYRIDPGEVYLATVRRGIELRDPTTDFRLMQFCLTIPERQFYYRGVDRWLLRRAMAGVLPTAVLDQHGGTGLQSADWYERVTVARAGLLRWIAALRRDPTARELLDLHRMQAILDEWPEKGARGKEQRRVGQGILLRGVAMGCFIGYVREGRVLSPGGRDATA